MNRLLLLLATSTLSACMTLPGSDNPPVTRYTLQGPGHACEAGDKLMTLSIVKVNAGLDTDRVARIDASSGEISYIKGIRWVDNVGPMLEQRLATDLECAGFAVQTGHHTRLGHDRLVCEVRALHLLQAPGSDQAVTGLSCVHYNPADKTETALIESSRVTLTDWNSRQTMEALSTAYGEVFDRLVSGLL